MIMFSSILITEYVPLSALLFTLFKSYRNNRERKCGPTIEDDFVEENEYDCEYPGQMSPYIGEKPRNESFNNSKHSGDSHPIYV